MVSDGAVEKLKAYDYPGNVRELENIIEQAVSMADKEHVLTEKNLALSSISRKSRQQDKTHEINLPLDKYLEEIELRIIEDALLECSGNISRTAEKLQIKRQTLQHKLKKYKINI